MDLHYISFPGDLGKSFNTHRLHPHSPDDVQPASLCLGFLPPKSGYGTRGKGGGQEGHGRRFGLGLAPGEIRMRAKRAPGAGDFEEVFI